MKKLVVVLILVAGLLSSVPSYARWRGTVEVDIVADSGEVLRTIPHTNHEDDQTLVVKKYLEAKRGQNYRIVVRNNTANRIGVVVAVDGRNIINGSVSNLRSNEAMYIVSPYSSEKLDGWRTDSDTTHKFYFTEPSDSYSVRTFADSSAMGVIAVAAFRERERPHQHLERAQPRAGELAPQAPTHNSAGKSLGGSAGTGFGDELYSPVVKVAFEPEGIPFSKTLIKYEWREVLCKKGILNCWTQGKNRLWDDGSYAPFPPDHCNR